MRLYIRDDVDRYNQLVEQYARLDGSDGLSEDDKALVAASSSYTPLSETAVRMHNLLALAHEVSKNSHEVSKIFVATEPSIASSPFQTFREELDGVDAILKKDVKYLEFEMAIQRLNKEKAELTAELQELQALPEGSDASQEAKRDELIDKIAEKAKHIGDYTSELTRHLGELRPALEAIKEDFMTDKQKAMFEILVSSSAVSRGGAAAAASDETADLEAKLNLAKLAILERSEQGQKAIEALNILNRAELPEGTDIGTYLLTVFDQMLPCIPARLFPEPSDLSAIRIALQQSSSVNFAKQKEQLEEILAGLKEMSQMWNFTGAATKRTVGVDAVEVPKGKSRKGLALYGCFSEQASPSRSKSPVKMSSGSPDSAASSAASSMTPEGFRALFRNFPKHSTRPVQSPWTRDALRNGQSV